MVRAHLSAVDSIFLAHGFLDEGVARLGGQGLAAKAGHELFRVPGEARVVNDPGPRVLLEEGFGQHAHHVVALNEGALVIPEEAAVEVAVEGHAEIRAGFPHGLPRHRLLVVEEGVGNAVGEGAVGGVEHLLKAESAAGPLESGF